MLNSTLYLSGVDVQNMSYKTLIQAFLVAIRKWICSYENNYPKALIRFERSERGYSVIHGRNWCSHQILANRSGERPKLCIQSEQSYL